MVFDLKYVLIFSLLFFLFLACYFFRYRRILSSQVLLLLCFFCGIYIISYIFQLYTAEPGLLTLWNMVQYTAFPFIPAFWLLFLIYESGNHSSLTPLNVMILFFIPYLTVFMRLTNNYHHLFYKIEYIREPHLFFEATNGPFYYLFFIYGTACMIISGVWLLRGLLRIERTLRIKRILLASFYLFPCLLLLLQLFGVLSCDIDCFVVALSFSVLLIILIIRKFNLLDEKEIVLAELQSNSELLKVIIGTIDPIIFIIDMDKRRIRTINHTFFTVFGLELDSKIDNAINQIKTLIHPDDRIEIQNLIGSFGLLMQNNDCISTEVRVLDAERRYIWIRLQFRSVKYKKGCAKQIVGSVSNINEERKKLEEFVIKAQFDQPTGLYNKETVQQKIEQYLSQKEHPNCLGAFLLFDIDNLKVINDKNGHYIGDKIINHIAKILKDNFCKHSIIGRLGGDEFVVFQKKVESTEQLVNLVEEAIEDIRELGDVLYISTQVSVSIGISLFPDDDVCFSQLYMKADLAMYNIKNANKNGLMFYDDSMQFSFE